MQTNITRASRFNDCRRNSKSKANIIKLALKLAKIKKTNCTVSTSASDTSRKAVS